LVFFFSIAGRALCPLSAAGAVVANVAAAS